MSTQQHTPGPWTVSRLGHGQIQILAKRSNLFEVCELDRRFSGLTEDEQNADARLIAAAPELLEAARAAIVAIMMPTTIDRSDVVVRLGNAVAKADGTVANAKGKTETADAR